MNTETKIEAQQAPELSEEEQLDLVIQDFGGKDSELKVLRSHPDIRRGVINLALRSASPSAFMEEIGIIAASARKFGRKLSCYKRDNQSHAVQHARRVIDEGGYVLPGYEYPVEQSTLATVLIFDFTALSLLAKWCRVDRLQTLRPPEKFVREGDQLAAEIAQQFPGLIEKGQHRNPIPSIMSIYAQMQSEKWKSVIGKLDSWKSEDSSRGSWIPDHRVHTLNTVGFHCVLRQMGYVLNAPLDEVLSLFSREEKEQISTWQIRIPKMISRTINIGFHPESFHQGVAKKRPGIIPSLGLSRGYGAAWLFEEAGVVKGYLDSIDQRPLGDSQLLLEDWKDSDPFAFFLRALS